MRYCLHVLMVAMITIVGVSTAGADVIVVGVNGSMSAGGTTLNYPISGTNLRPGGSATSISQRWDATAPLGITGGVFQGTFGGTDASSNDWHVLIGDTNPTGARALDKVVGGPTGFNYVEIFYSLDSNVEASSPHRFAVDGNSPAETFSAANQALLPTTAGSHSFVIDLNELDNVQGADNELDYIRWDPWNENDTGNLNRGTVFSISQVTFGTELVAVPEPSSLAMLGLGIVGLVSRRRK